MKKRILLVDDIDFILEFEEKVIESLQKELRIPLAIDKANSVEEASKLLEEHDYTLAIVDMELPDGSGIEVAKKISDMGKATRVAALTIYPDRFDKEREYFDAYFKKPILPSTYKENLKLLLG